MNLKKGLRARKPNSAIDITPLVDIVFNLLIFLLLSTTFKTREESFSIVLPVGDQQTRVTRVSRPSVFITKDGEYILFVSGNDPENPTAGTGPVSLDTLSAELGRLARTKGLDLSISVRADGGTDYQSVMNVVNECYRHGIERVYFPYKSSGP